MCETWIQIFSLFLLMLFLVLWFRMESRNDWRHIDGQLKDIQDRVNGLLNDIEKRNKK